MNTYIVVFCLGSIAGSLATGLLAALWLKREIRKDGGRYD